MTAHSQPGQAQPQTRTGSAAVTVTIFKDVAAQSLQQRTCTLQQLKDDLIDAAKASAATVDEAKKKLPLLKLGRYGDKRSDKNSLRHDYNVEAIGGIIGDHDAGTMSFDEACGRIRAAGLAAIVHTTPRSTPESPRFHALCWCSREYEPAEHDRFVDRLNGVLDGALGQESWSRHLAFYFGRVNDDLHYRSELIEGTPIDLIEGLPEVGKPASQSAKVTKGNGATGGTAGNVIDLAAILGPVPAHIANNPDRPNQNANAHAGMPLRFEDLAPEQMNEILEAMLAWPAIVALADLPRPDGWLDILFAIAHAGHLGASQARQLALAWCMTSPRFKSEAKFDRDWGSFAVRDGGITVGTLIAKARATGFDTSPWLAPEPQAAAAGCGAATPITAGHGQGQGAGAGAAAPGPGQPQATGGAPGQAKGVNWSNPFKKRLGTSSSGAAGQQPMSGTLLTQLPHEMTITEATRYLTPLICKVGNWGGKPYIARFTSDGSVVALAKEELNTLLAGHFVKVPGSNDPVPASTWWMNSASKLVYDVYRYDPERKYERPGESVLNTWRGFAIEPVQGSWKTLKRHLWTVICRHNHASYKYLLRWLAHSVRYPGTNPETMVVIRSDEEGVGKSSVGYWLFRIFGIHGLEVANTDMIFGQYNEAIGNISYIQLEEPVFPGDHRGAGMLRAMITGKTILINPKHRTPYSIPHGIHFLMTTNGAWAIPAGAEARRFLMLDAALPAMTEGERRDYFKALWAEAQNGGIAAMLHDLLAMDLSRFDPRRVPTTGALIEQQWRSADDVIQWLAGTLIDGMIVPGAPNGGFGASHPTAQLYGIYLEWCRSQGFRRPKNNIAFGIALRKLGLNRGAGNNPPTWSVPDQTTLATAMRRAGGIKRRTR